MFNLDIKIEENFREAIVIVNSNNLYSSMCDAVNLVHLFHDYFKIDIVHVIVDDINIKKKIEDKINFYHENTNFIVSNDLLQSFENVLKMTKQNMLITISSHGYACRDNNYINWCEKTIYDQDLRDALIKNLNDNLNCLIFVDTCQSGTMFNLNYRTNDLVNYKPENLSDCKLDIICISAVDDYEYDQDDLSDFGINGGLTSSFIDFINEKIGMTIREFFVYHKNRVSVVGKNPVLSFNNNKII